MTDLEHRIKDSNRLTQQEKLVFGILANQSMTSRHILDCVMSEPYNLNFQEASRALNSLNQKGLLAIGRLVPDRTTMEVDVKLTFTEYWLFKL